jgi:xanthine dehydrogenase iron-sulfur cluster and FAD-binding subunit A
MAGNICRCACYNRIESAIRIAAGLEPAGESHDKERTDVV